MSSIGTLAVNIVARTEKFAKGMTKSVGLMSRFASVVGRASRVVATFGGAAAAAAVGIGAIFVKKQLAAVDAIAKMSDRLNIGTETLSKFGHVAEIYGASQEGITKGLKDMVRRLGEASQGFGQARPALKRLGLEAEGLVGLTADEQFLKIAESLRKVQTQAERTSLTYAIFGRSGVDLLNLIQAGPEEIRKEFRFAEIAGLTVSRKMAAAVERANDAITRLRAAFTGLFRQITVRIAPLIEHAFTKVADFIVSDGKIQTFADGIARGIGHVVAGVIRAFDTIRKVALKVGSIVGSLLAGIATSPIANEFAGRLGVQGGTLRDIGKLGDSLRFNSQRSLDGLAKDPASNFLMWFNKHLEDAMRDSGNMPAAKRIAAIGNKLALGDLSGALGMARGFFARTQGMLAAKAPASFQPARGLNTALVQGTREAAIAAARPNPMRMIAQKQLAATEKAEGHLSNIGKAIAENPTAVQLILGGLF